MEKTFHFNFFLSLIYDRLDLKQTKKKEKANLMMKFRKYFCAISIIINFTREKSNIPKLMSDLQFLIRIKNLSGSFKKKLNVKKETVPI